MAQQQVPLAQVIQKVQSMVRDQNALRIVRKEKYNIHNVTWEDCARNKGSVWGPCISDMTLQVGNSRMPVIRENNFTDCTWDVKMDKIPIVVGNEKKINNKMNDKISDEKTDNSNNNNNNNNNKNDNNESKLKTVSLKEYLENFDQYMTCPPKSVNPFMLESMNDKNKKLNLLRKDKEKDSHVIVSSQACFLPIEKGKETLFNVALFNYQSKKSNPAILCIIATSKGTSAQIIEGTQQKLLFNNFGRKADFIGQRLTDNRIERGIKDLTKPMTTQEKQDNCIVIIQVPLKQKSSFSHQYNYGYNVNFSNYRGRGGYGPVRGRGFGPVCNGLGRGRGYPSYRGGRGSFGRGGRGGYAGGRGMSSGMPRGGARGRGRGRGANAPVPQMARRCMPMRHRSNSRSRSRSTSLENEANVESAIVKIAPKTHPVCKCGDELVKLQLRFCYDNFGKQFSQMCRIFCDKCSKEILDGNTDAEKKCTIVWHCKREKTTFEHSTGYDLCDKCATKQLAFDELNGLNTIERDERYPIRVTLQYYKSTDNGIITEAIMKVISQQLKTSQKQSDYIGSLVTQHNTQRPTEWDIYSPFRFNPKIDSKDENFSLIKDVLGNLGLSQYYNSFVKNDINDKRLILMEESDLRLLFDKIGPLMVFRKWLRSYQTTSNDKNKEKNNNKNGNGNEGKMQDISMG